MEESKRETANFSQVNDDVLQYILLRLPARPFAAASCVNKSWNRVSNRILSRPKLASAVSLNDCPKLALEEVVNRVLSEPIRPHFAIASIGHLDESEFAHKYMIEKLGSRTPMVLSYPRGGLLGRDAVTNEFREARLGTEVDGRRLPHSGISLTIGYLPGVKVDAIPLYNPEKEPNEERINKFVMDIRKFTADVSGGTSPIGILMFGGDNMDQKPVIEKLDYAMPLETVIVGDNSSLELYYSSNYSKNMFGVPRDDLAAVALVFANDKNKDHGTGSIQFHYAISEGISAFGPTYKVFTAGLDDSGTESSTDTVTWLTATREGQNNNVLDGEQLLNAADDELNKHMPCAAWLTPERYIGVTKRRNYSIGSEKPSSMTSLMIHGILSGYDKLRYLFAYGNDIKPGDTFQFYVANPEAATSSNIAASEFFRTMKLDWEAKSKEAFGGFIFFCCIRWMSLFNERNVESSPFLNNFPNIPVAGAFCSGVIARGGNGNGNGIVGRSQHVYSNVYLVMTYTPCDGQV